MKDIAARKRVEEELQNSETRFRRTLDNMLEGCMLLGFDWTYLYLNETAAKHGQSRREDLIGRTMPEMYPGVEKSAVFAHYKRCMEERIPQHFEESFTFADGTTAWYEFRTEPVPEGIFVLSLDISARKSSELALKEAVAKARNFSEALDNIPSYIYMKGLDHKYFYANKTTLKLFNCSAGELPGSGDEKFFPPETVERLKAVDDRVLDRGETTMEEIDVSPGTPERRVYWEVKHPIYDDAGGIIGLCGISTDITERKTLEEALKESEKLLKTILELMPVGVWMLDAGGNLTFGNEAASKIWSGKRLVPIDQFGEYKGWRIEGGKQMEPHDWAGVRALERGETTINEEVLIECFDGTKKVILDSAIPIRAADGSIKGAVTINQDITERKAAEREKEQLVLELSRKATEKDAILASQNNVVLTYDLNMNAQQVNPAFLKIYGFDPVGLNVKEIIRRVNCRMMDGSPLNLEEQPTPKALKGEMTDSSLYMVTKADGSTGFVDTSSRPLLVKGGIAGSVTVWHDITDLKVKEREAQAAKDAAEDATRLKDKFVSLVAHDLKGPLGSLVAYLKGLSRSTFSPEDTGKIYSTAIAAGENMLGLIEDLLNISRIKMGKLKPDFKFVPAYFFAVKAVEEFRYRAEQKGIAIEDGVHRDARLFADETLFYEVVRNLVSNAVKFSGPGQRVRIFTPAGKPSAIAVSDEGIGIDNARLPHLFEYETKTSTAGTAGEMGTGLGLPLSREIVEAHGGKLTVESVKGKGSVFSAELPLVKPKVLFADNDRLVGTLLELYVADMGLELKSVINGREAIETVGVWKPDMVITDVKVSEVDGFELVEFIRKNSATANVPIILTSAFSDLELAARITNAHVDGFILKPFIAEEVTSKIRQILG